VPALPFVILVMTPFIEQIDPNLEAAARIFGAKELSKNNFYKLTCPDSMKGWMRTKLESQRSSGH
jgi:ABC-type spermidine/putrescine transport system permease subunit II